MSFYFYLYKHITEALISCTKHVSAAHLLHQVDMIQLYHKQKHSDVCVRGKNLMHE